MYDVHLTSIRINFNTLKFISKTQRLIKHGLDGSMCVDDEETYNKMNQAINTLRENCLTVSIYHVIIKLILIV